MNIYWTFKQIPELRDLPKDQRKRVWLDCYMTPKHKVINLFVLPTVLVSVVWLTSQAKMSTWTSTVLAGLSAGLISFILQQMQFERLRSSIREYLKEHKVI